MEKISFELHLEKWHEKTQKPLWFLGFPNRYLFRFAMLALRTDLDIDKIELSYNDARLEYSLKDGSEITVMYDLR